MWKYYRYYDYIINRIFHTKKLLKWNGLVVHRCLYNKIEKQHTQREILYLCTAMYYKKNQLI